MGAVLLRAYSPERAEAALPLHTRNRDYVGASVCRSCHLDHFASWRRTYHSTMTQLPTPESVLGRFDGAAVTAFGSSATPLERDGRFYFQLPATRTDPSREAEVALSVGSRRYQQYFERIGAGEQVSYRRLPLLWHVAEARWMHLNGVFLERDSDDWTQHQSLWNVNCIFCHNTGVVPGVRKSSSGLDLESDSSVSDLGVSCEACHGPGRAHAERNRSPVQRYLSQLKLSPPQTDIVNPARLAQPQSLAVCGQCHSQRLPDPVEKLWTYLATGPTFRPGDVLAGHVTPLTRDTPVPDPTAPPDTYRNRFWSDGTARLTSYEYLGITQSPCLKDPNFTCRSCHTMHGGDVKGQIEPSMRGDRACTQCHTQIGQNISAHTHHPAESSGSRCLDCHMPKTVYGILTTHRSHRIESPDAKRDVEGSRPNACTLCHLDRSARWAGERMQALWGPRFGPAVQRPDGLPVDVPDALAAAHAGDPIQRAVYLAQLGRDDSATPARERGFLLANALVGFGDQYGALRFIARGTALRLDASLGLGLASELGAFDVQGPERERSQALRGLLHRFEAAAKERLPPPPPGLLVGPDYRLEFANVSSLIDRQMSHPIETGE